jgi:hypothetical protein
MEILLEWQKVFEDSSSSCCVSQLINYPLISFLSAALSAPPSEEREVSLRGEICCPISSKFDGVSHDS